MLLSEHAITSAAFPRQVDNGHHTNVEEFEDGEDWQLIYTAPPPEATPTQHIAFLDESSDEDMLRWEAAP